MKGNSRRNEPVCPVRELSRASMYPITINEKIELARVEARPKPCKICEVNATAQLVSLIVLHIATIIKKDRTADRAAGYLSK